MPVPVFAASVRQEVADFVAALFWVYSLILVAYIVVSLVMSLGLTPPYNRAVRGVLDFLHDTSEPYLRIFRRLGLQIGPLDLSPIIALIVLRIVGGVLVGAIDPGGCDRRPRRGRPPWRASSSTRPRRRSCAPRSGGEPSSRSCRGSRWSTPATPAWRSGCSTAAGRS